MFPISRKQYVLITNKDGCFGIFPSESSIKIIAVPNITFLNFKATVLDNILEKCKFIYSL